MLEPAYNPTLWSQQQNARESTSPVRYILSITVDYVLRRPKLVRIEKSLQTETTSTSLARVVETQLTVVCRYCFTTDLEALKGAKMATYLFRAQCSSRIGLQILLHLLHLLYLLVISVYSRQQKDQCYKVEGLTHATYQYVCC